MVNTCRQDTFETDKQLKSVSEFITVDIDGYSQVKIACYFTNVKGELETILKAIKINREGRTRLAECILGAGINLTFGNPRLPPYSMHTSSGSL